MAASRCDYAVTLEFDGVTYERVMRDELDRYNAGCRAAWQLDREMTARLKREIGVDEIRVYSVRCVEG